MNPSVAFYIGGFETIGGIEACFQDLAVGLARAPLDRSMFIWAEDLPQLRAIAASGATVHRTGLRRGCRYNLPDWVLYLVSRPALKAADRIVFGKIPPRPVLQQMLAMLDQRPGGRPETMYLTPYRPRELWPAGPPGWVREAIDTMVVQSPDFAADLRGAGFTGRIVEIPYLPPLAADPPCAEAPAQRCKLGFLGRFVPQKNLFYLLDMLAGLGDEDVELHLFGEGEHDTRLRTHVAERGLRAIFHGAIPRVGVPAAIDGCNIFLNPSLSEGQCLVALEVLSRGRPFLASGVGAIPQILARGHFGEVLPLGDASAAAAVVRRVIGEWRAGDWDPVAVAHDYAAAYRPADILARYLALFSGTDLAA